jgi:hypothetical protein
MRSHPRQNLQVPSSHRSRNGARIGAFVVLTLVGLSISKLAFKPSAERAADDAMRAEPEHPPGDVGSLRAKYARASAADRELVDRTIERYRQNAERIERSDGLRGLRLLDRLDLEAIAIYDQSPALFRDLRALIGDDAAAEILGHWTEYFGLKHGNDLDREIFVRQIARLPWRAKRAAAQLPAALPLLLAAPDEVADLIDRLHDDPVALGESLAILDLIAIDRGADDIRRAIATIDRHGSLAVDAFRRFGPEGFALAARFGPLIESLAGRIGLDRTLALLWSNADDLRELLDRRSPESIARVANHLDELGLLEAAGSTPHGLRFVIELGPLGERVLRRSGADGVDLVEAWYASPEMRRHAAEALAEFGPMALAVLEKFAEYAEFREILVRFGAAVVPPIAQSDESFRSLATLEGKSDKTIPEMMAQGVLAVSGESGQATIRMIRIDGLERAREVQTTELHFAQFLPTYDILHLGHVMARGHAPTSGESAWALVDAAFLVWDGLSLLAIQPEGAVVGEATRSSVKSAARGALQATSDEWIEGVVGAVGKRSARGSAEQAIERASRWWAVRKAGGPFRLMLERPRVLAWRPIDELVNESRPICSKWGLRLATFQPLRYMRAGEVIVRRLPRTVRPAGLAAQAAFGQVTVVAWSRMEEYLASKRQPEARAESDPNQINRKLLAGSHEYRRITP